MRCCCDVLTHFWIFVPCPWEGKVSPAALLSMDHFTIAGKNKLRSPLVLITRADCITAQGQMSAGIP